ncbi:MAG: phenylalanine--tRNA ligase subunit alpha, partial [Cytophagales bacterium]|nr:phenylalanine--tRNA ligase subunit alpha [Cytophagales bacterium]
MTDRIQDLRSRIESTSIETPEQLEQFRLAYVSKKGEVAALFDNLKSIDPADRRAVGAELNALKNLAETIFKDKQTWMEEQRQSAQQAAPVDLTLPVHPNEFGSVHPLTLVRNRIIEIFGRMGFAVADGPEIEDDWHNFAALNFAENHPAREMQDTFFIRKGDNPADDLLLRTHTSGVQVRLMERQKPPIRAIMPG